MKKHGQIAFRPGLKARGAKTKAKTAPAKANKSPAKAKKAPAAKKMSVDSTKKKNTLAAGSGGKNQAVPHSNDPAANRKHRRIELDLKRRGKKRKVTVSGSKNVK